MHRTHYKMLAIVFALNGLVLAGGISVPYGAFDDLLWEPFVVIFRPVLSVGYGFFVGYGNAPYPTNLGICRVRNVSKSKSKSMSKPKPNSLLSKTLGGLVYFASYLYGGRSPPYN